MKCQQTIGFSSFKKTVRTKVLTKYSAIPSIANETCATPLFLYNFSMDAQQYRERKKKRLQDQQVFREKCLGCWQPSFGCFCHLVKPFDPNIQFVILIHPKEARKRIATGRMAHICLENSEFYRGCNFDKHQGINSLIADSNRQCVMLFPSPQATNLSDISETKKTTLFSKKAKLTVFVMDGTWSNTAKMFRLSPKLKALPQISFSPERTSTFRVRKQPSPHCLSTIEAIHHLIELLGPSRGFSLKSQQHNNLMDVFNWLVEDQIHKLNTYDSQYRKPNSGKNRDGIQHLI